MSQSVINTVRATKKFPFFLNTLPYNGKFAFVFVSVAFYNLPCFYCCVSILKARREERLKNGKKNGGKTVQKTVRKIITVQGTF